MNNRPAHLAALDVLDAVAYVVIRPAPATDDTDDLGTYAVEAASHGMSKAAAAYALRQVADRFEVDAIAAGEELDTDTVAAADARNSQRPASPRPAGLDALLGYVAANLPDVEQPTEEPFVPRTERSYWQDIADALNTAHHIGMPVGIELDGTLTDHRAWSVVWDREAERWAVAGYDDDQAAEEQPTHEGPDPSHGGLTTHRGRREDCTGPDCEPERCENCGHVPHGHAEHLTNPDALRDCPHCPCATELREMNGEAPGDEPEQPVTLTLGDRADHAIGLYARTAIERDDARAENAKLRAERDELIRQRDRIANDTAAALAEQPATPRRILTEQELDTAYYAARGEIGMWASRVGAAAITEAVVAALATAGILTPAPDPDPETCPAMLADPRGAWHQCAEDIGHDPADGHDSGEWSWAHGETYARPEPTEEAGR
ncbi:hypothetical protein ACFRQM_04410 [Streptomyces sp. NPDC056831]|uniref:hypothetical protein n=1 Tax=Streptomyces sp. NPDC056831 TaxID=3345954 RepID=UPI003692D4E3